MDGIPVGHTLTLYLQEPNKYEPLNQAIILYQFHSNTGGRGGSGDLDQEHVMEKIYLIVIKVYRILVSDSSIPFPH